MDYNYATKISNIYRCDNCDYKCCKYSDYNKHILTRKHLMDDTGVTADDAVYRQPDKLFECDCGNKYKYRQGLHKHKKICHSNKGVNTNPSTQSTQSIQSMQSIQSIQSMQSIQSTTVEDNGFQIDKEMLIKMLLSNQDVMKTMILKNQDVMEKMMEIIPCLGNQVHTNSHNTTNNQFNIQMFLNEHCKNAMNLKDFIETLPITAATYDSTIENGLTKTITNMITNGLSKLDILERPIHCTDATRKTLYVKEANIWEKDTELLKVVSGITTLIRKKRTLISRWKEANEGWDTIERKQIKFTELVCNIMTDIEYDEKETGKIVRSISKTVYLDSEDKKKYLC